MTLHSTYLLLILLASTTVVEGLQIDEWLLQRNKKGIKIFTKKSKWGKLRDSRADMLVTGSTIEELTKLILDFDRYPTWLPRCKEARVLARMGDDEFIAHMVFRSPWPVADRDCVVRVNRSIDPKTGSVTIRETSEPKYINKNENVVRIEQMYSTWHLVPTNGGVQVSNEFASNPGGNIPDWIINTQSVDNPYDIFSTLQSVIPSTSGRGKGGK